MPWGRSTAGTVIIRRRSPAALLALTILAGAAALAGVLATPGAAAAHEELRASSPAAGDSLSAAPEALRLTFVNPVRLSFARLTVEGPGGAVSLGELRRDSAAANVLMGTITGPLEAGTYTVRWQVAGPDGHAVRGTYSFTLLPGAEGLAAPGAGEPAAPEGTGAGGTVGPADTSASGVGDPAPDDAAIPVTSFHSGSPMYAAVRWLTFAGLLGLIGTVAFRLLVLPAATREDSVDGGLAHHLDRRLLVLGLAAGALLLVALLLRLYAQSYTLNGPEGLEPQRLRAVLGDSSWATGWWLQAGASVLALAGLSLAWRRSAAGWALAALAAVALAVTPALSGHAAGTDPVALAVLADSLHVLGAGGWLGSLLALTVVALPVTLRQSRRNPGAAAALVNAFSPTALAFAGLVVLTGVVSGALHLDSIAALWETPYGRTLLIKVGLLAILFGTGAYNWRVVRPALARGADPGGVRQSTALELLVGAAVLAATAVLVATPPDA